MLKPGAKISVYGRPCRVVYVGRVTKGGGWHTRVTVKDLLTDRMSSHRLGVSLRPTPLPYTATA